MHGAVDHFSGKDAHLKCVGRELAVELVPIGRCRRWTIQRLPQQRHRQHVKDAVRWRLLDRERHEVGVISGGEESILDTRCLLRRGQKALE